MAGVPMVMSPNGPVPAPGHARIYAVAPTAMIAAAKAANGRTASLSTSSVAGSSPAGAANGSSSFNPFDSEDVFDDKAPLRSQSSTLLSRRRETVGSLVGEDNRHIRGGGKFAELLTSRPGYFRETGSRVAQFPQNVPRNRYKDILPYDDNRVHLQADNDFVNASPVRYNGGDFHLDYIATQGPKDVTAAHFWQMVEENNVTLICMLTALQEGGRSKCYQYWPVSVGHEEQYGQYLLHFDAEETDASGAFVVRTFTLQAPTCLRTIHHVQFTEWPDHGVPDESEHFMTYMDRVQQLKASVPLSPAPVIVHCSAGIGRTGVLIVLEIACALFERNRGVDLADVIRTLRTQRMGLVQTEGQYQFIYKILAGMRRNELPVISIVTTQ